MRFPQSAVRRGFLAVAILAIALAGSASAQFSKKAQEPKERTVEGVVSDAAGAPVPNAVVQLTNTRNQQIRSFIAKEKGDYYFNGLSPDVDYTLRAEFNGASSPLKTLSAYDSRKQAVINLKLNK
jgi:hypothetical protein